MGHRVGEEWYLRPLRTLDKPHRMCAIITLWKLVQCAGEGDPVPSSDDGLILLPTGSLADRRYPLRSFPIPPSHRTARLTIVAHIQIAEAILVSPLHSPSYPWYLLLCLP